MWICTIHGFFSLTKSTTVPGAFQFRARVRKDLENLIEHFQLEEEIIETPQADYRWRLLVLPHVAGEFLQEMVEEIDYSNFKNAIHGQPSQTNKNGPYMEIWSVMKGVQDREGTGRRIAYVKETTFQDKPTEARKSMESFEDKQCKACGRGLGAHRIHDNACPEGEGFHAICRFKLDPNPRPPVNPPQGWTVSKGAFNFSKKSWSFRIKRGSQLMEVFTAIGESKFMGRQQALKKAHQLHARKP